LRILLAGIVFSVLLLVPVGVQNVFASPDFCTAAQNNLDVLSSGAYLEYLLSCTDFEIVEEGFGFDDLFKPSTIETVGPNTKINSDPVGVTASRNTQSEVSIDSCGDSVVAGYNDSANFGFFSGFSHSQDGGNTWIDGGQIPLANAGDRNSGDPSVKADPSNCNIFYYAQLVRTASGLSIGVSKSIDGGQTFSAPVIVATPATGNFLDREWIDVDSSGTIHITYTRFTPTASGETVYAQSTDGGLTWMNFNTFEPGVSAFGAIPVIDQSNENNIYVFYVNRNTLQIKFSKSTDGGLNWSAPANIASFARINQFVECNPGGTSNIRPVWNGNLRFLMFVTAETNPTNGEVYVAWHTAELPGGDSETDVVFFRSSDGGNTWTGPTSPHPPSIDIDQFHPWMDVTPSGEIKMIWYDRRNDSNNFLIDLYASSSQDGGLTWQQPNVRVTTTSFGIPPITPPNDFGVAGCYFIGEYNGIDTPNNEFAHVAWGDGRLLTTDGFAQADIFYSKLFQKIEVVGGELIPIETTALLLASAQTFSWMIPVILSGIGIGLLVVSRKSKNS